MLKGDGRAPLPPNQPGLIFHHDGMYARIWQSPLCVYSVAQTVQPAETMTRKTGLDRHLAQLSWRRWTVMEAALTGAAEL